MRGDSAPGRRPAPGRRRRRTGERAVAVEGGALTREVGRRVAELLEVRHAGVEVVARARVAEHDVAGRAAARWRRSRWSGRSGRRDPRPSAAALARSRGRPGGAGRRRSRARSAGRRQAVWSSQGWEAAIVAGSSRMPGVRSRAKVRRKGRVALVWRSEGSAISQRGPSSLIVRSRLRRLGGERPGDGVEVADQPLELGLVAAERVEDLRLTGDQGGEIVRLGPLQRLVDDRRVPGGRLRRSRRTC